MIDHRLTEGIKVDFFGKNAATTTLPAQFVKKFNAEIIPVHIFRDKNFKFKKKKFKNRKRPKKFSFKKFKRN